jgi:hypothetical protein
MLVEKRNEDVKPGDVVVTWVMTRQGTFIQRLQSEDGVRTSVKLWPDCQIQVDPHFVLECRRQVGYDRWMIISTDSSFYLSRDFLYVTVLLPDEVSGA